MADEENVETKQTEEVAEPVETVVSADIGTRIVGQVKWFNPKAGYGFITYKLDEESHDIFVHHTCIKYTTAPGTFRNLVDGEYVEFTITNGSAGKQAGDVTGVNGGTLLTEIRNNRKKNVSQNNA
tara:strand:- start:2284 stop:2658 length:375 start_codon:yes stop_codon:yes gene_type:complete